LHQLGTRLWALRLIIRRPKVISCRPNVLRRQRLAPQQYIGCLETGLSASEHLTYLLDDLVDRLGQLERPSLRSGHLERALEVPPRRNGIWLGQGCLARGDGLRNPLLGSGPLKL
jgi:hypothetical protein